MADVGFPRSVASGVPEELEARVAGVTLRGTSLAARATAFAVPELGVALDLGRLTPTLAEQPVVLLSHAHMDHISGILAYLNLRARFHRDAPPRIACPLTVAAPLRQAFEVMPGMESVRKRLDLNEVIVGVEAGQSVRLPGGIATAFAVDHPVPTLGWRLAAARGERPLVVFAADGSTSPFAADPGLLDAEVAIAECTFLEKNRRVAARLSGHAHIADWVEIAPHLPCDTLVLSHLPPLEPAAVRRLARPLAAAFPGELIAWTAERLRSGR